MTNPEIDNFGTKRWYNDKGQLHRENGPAVEFADGTIFWFKNGNVHRYDGPALIYRSGRESWYVNDKQIFYIKPILERLDISPDWQNWTDEEKFLVRLALP